MNMNDMNYQAAQVENQTCPTISYQQADVCVPVTVSPYATAGTTTTHCCGDPIVVSGKNTCAGRKGDVCVFTVTQRVCVEVPVAFGATATVGDAYVDCLGASAEENTCSQCGESITAN